MMFTIEVVKVSGATFTVAARDAADGAKYLDMVFFTLADVKSVKVSSRDGRVIGTARRSGSGWTLR